MKVKKKILAVCVTRLLLMGVCFDFVACDDWHYDLESDKLWSIDETSMRDQNSEFVTLKVGETPVFTKDVLMRKDAFAANPFFNMFTDEGYDIGLGTTTNKLSYLKKNVVGRLEVQYLRLGGRNYFYDFEDRDDLWEAAWRSPDRSPALESNSVSDALKEKLKPTVNASSMNGLERKYFIIEHQIRVNWRKETAVFQAKVYGSEERVEVAVRTDSTFYRNVLNALNTQDTSDNNLSRVFGGVNYKNQWYLVHQV